MEAMEKLTFEKDVKVFGIEVKTFPAGIGEAFDELIKKTGDGAGERNYYGISSMSNEGKMMYKAVAEEKFEGEAKKLNYDEGVIEKGKYLYEALYHWQNKTCLIKDIFHSIMNDDHVDKTKPCIEWYKNDDEMLCMVKVK
jgi:predicted transcriptional regulator YdeE